MATATIARRPGRPPVIQEDGNIRRVNVGGTTFAFTRRADGALIPTEGTGELRGTADYEYALARVRGLV